jgi:hypothetical protein
MQCESESRSHIHSHAHTLHTLGLSDEIDTVRKRVSTLQDDSVAAAAAAAAASEKVRADAAAAAAVATTATRSNLKHAREEDAHARRWCDCSCDVHLCSLPCYSLGGAISLVTIIRVLCTLRTQI